MQTTGKIKLPAGKKVAVNIGCDFDAQSILDGSFNLTSPAYMARGSLVLRLVLLDYLNYLRSFKREAFEKLHTYLGVYKLGRFFIQFVNLVCSILDARCFWTRFSSDNLYYRHGQPSQYFGVYIMWVVGREDWFS